MPSRTSPSAGFSPVRRTSGARAIANLGVGTVAQWWLSRTVALQGTALSGLGFGPVGTVGDRAERDYHYGLVPQMLLGLRLILGEVAMLEAAGRHYVVVGVDSAGHEDVGLETISRATGPQFLKPSAILAPFTTRVGFRFLF